MPFLPLRRLLAAAPLAIAALAAAPAAEAGPFSSLVIFGDSLSDDGNNFAAGLFDPGQVATGNSYVPSFTYASHAYSNRPVWATDFAAKIGVPLTASATGGTDYAYGGATMGPNPSAFPFSLLTQTSAYLTSRTRPTPAAPLPTPTAANTSTGTASTRQPPATPPSPCDVCLRRAGARTRDLGASRRRPVP